MNIQLSKVRDIVLEPARIKSTDMIVIREISDNTNDKRVTAFTNLRDIELWSGDEYDKIGNWTDEDVIARMLELFDKDA
jgi:hypothetical protein